jgi:hypothetical protein
MESQGARSGRPAGVYPWVMHLPVHFDFHQNPARVRRVVGIAWSLIAVKCLLVWWAIIHWNVPFHPLWIVGPTLMFAFLATALWVNHQED